MYNVVIVSALPMLGLQTPNGVPAFVEMSKVKMNGLCALRKATKMLVTITCGINTCIDLR
jgi:hypothetical protein